MRRKMFPLILIFGFNFFSIHTFAFTKGEDVIYGYIYYKKDTNLLKFELKKMKYRFNLNEKDFYSKKSTDWKVVLKDKNENVLDSSFLILKKGGNLFFSPLTSVDMYGVNKKPDADHHEWARFVFKYTKKSYKVELFFNGELKASAFVNDQ